MAWVRTATSLITFGFTLYKFFFYLQEQEPAKHAEQFLGPRTYGLIMIGIGVFTLAAAAWQHRQQMKPLRAQYADAPFSLSLVLAALIAVLGILGFIAAAPSGVGVPQPGVCNTRRRKEPCTSPTTRCCPKTRRRS